MARHRWLFLFLLALHVPQLPAQSVDVKEFTLTNGLRVLAVEDHVVPSVCFAVMFQVGSRNERPGITGLSHLFEHMMFNGSKKYKPTEFDKILETGGGYSNAFTGRDITFYYEELNPDLLDKVLDMEADRMRALKLDKENIEQERGIVKEERRVSTDNDVRGKIFEDLYATAYIAHPYRTPIIGWTNDLGNITLQDAKDYFRMYYAPNNATVIVVGAFDGHSLPAKMRKVFGGIPRGPAAAPVNNPEPPQLGERRVQLHKKAELPAVAIGYKGASVSSGDFYAVDLLCAILVQGESSRLYKRLVHDLQIAVDLGGGVEEAVDPGLAYFYVQLQPGKSVEDAEGEMYSVLHDIAEQGVLDEELQKAKNFVQMNYANEFKTNAGIAVRLGRFQGIYGGYKKAFEAPEQYAKVAAQDIKRVAQLYFSDRMRSVVVLIPAKNSAPSSDAETRQ